MRKNVSIRRIVYGGVIAALYAALTVALAPISFGAIQFRVSEALTVLPFFMPETVWGLAVGCFAANLYTGNPYDIVLGTAATVIAAVITNHIGRRHDRRFDVKKCWYAPLPAVISNGVIIGFVLKYLYVGATTLPYPAVALSVGIEEAGVCYVLGLPLMLFLNKYLSEEAHLI